MLKIKFTLLALILLILPIAFSQTLIDSENFDNYSVYQYGINIYQNRDLLQNQSGGKWNCTQSLSYPNCQYVFGTGGYNSNFSIDSWGYINTTNNYLRVWSFANSIPTGNYYHLGLIWTHNNLTLTTTSNHTISFKIKYFNFLQEPKTIPASSQNYGGVLDKSVKGILNGGFGFSAGRVNLLLNATPEEDYNHVNQIRPFYNQASNLNEPSTDTACNVMDGLWHEITLHLINSSSATTKYESIYIDGGLCIINHSMTLSASPYRYLEVFSAHSYDFGVDDIKIYDGIVPPQSPEYYEVSENLGYCPVASCIFYDNFDLYSSNYTTNFSVSHPTAPNDNDWDYAEGLVNIINDDLYLNSSVWGTQGRNADFTHPLDSHSQYDKIVGIIQFKINGSTPTPSSMITEFVSYRFNTYCDIGLTASSIPVYFMRNDDWTLSENSTAINVYVNEDGLRLLGTITLDNIQSFYIKQEIDYMTGIAKLTIVRDTESEEFSSGYMFTSPMMQNCRISSFSITRGDIQNPEDHFIGVDKVYFYGISSADGNTTYQYINETSFNDSIVKTDIGEQVQNAITSLGFRTTLSKILLWAILTVVIIIAVAKSPLGDSGKLFGIIVAQFAVTIAMYYFQIIPLTLFVVIIFIYAMVSALALYNLFGNKQSG